MEWPDLRRHDAVKSLRRPGGSRASAPADLRPTPSRRATRKRGAAALMTAVLPGHDSATGLHALADREMLERPSPKKARPSTTETDLQLRPEADDSSGKEKLGLAALIGLGESEPNVQQPSPTNKISKASFEAHKKAERKERNRLSAERHRKKQREHTENLEWALAPAPPGPTSCPIPPQPHQPHCSAPLARETRRLLVDRA